MPGAVFLEGDRVELRTIEEEDYEKLRNWVNNYDVRRFIGVRQPMNMNQEEEFLNNELEDSSKILLGICVDGELVGDIKIAEKEPGVAHLGLLVDPDRHGNGYGTEASKLIIEHAFEQMRYHKVVARVLDSNEKSSRVWEKLGFEHEATLREHVFMDGEYHDFLLYGLLEKEFEP